MENVSKRRCERCDLPLERGELCGNPLCNSPIRMFDCNYAIAIKSGHLDRAIKRYKFEDKKHWATIFARVLVGFFEEEKEVFDTFDLIVASPTFTSRDPQDRPWDHTRLVIETAHAESRGRWPFDVGFPQPAIIKTRRTPSMTNKKWKERQAIAHGELRASLVIPDRRRTAGRSILVYDDVFTDGHTLSEVARCLKVKGGAADICGVTLARQPWTKKATAS
jgi:predicted amidophosphoribosyltransferase